MKLVLNRVGRAAIPPARKRRQLVMDEDPILEQLREINRNLHYIVTLLVFVAIGAFCAGRGAVLEHGFWAIIGF
ncbi:MAG TPA: hypothetical protein VGO47_12180 [Chlamydiales bacterium]|nr:hypothetical protein [Chlamydiales bacterium]